MVTKEKRKRYNKTFRQKHPNWRKEWNKTHKESIKNSELKTDHNMTLDEYNSKLREQRGVCAICGRPETAKSNKGNKIKQLGVDHNHQTNKNRGLLCNACNIMIACSKEDITILQNGITYLLKYESENL